jgi:N6-adenosine-specific RNA methylase IME4
MRSERPTRRTCSDRCRQQLSRGRVRLPLPEGPYSLIYADPPWQHNDRANAGMRGACHKYPVMPLGDIKRLPVNGIAARDCLLALWWSPVMPEEAIAVARAWGFEPRTMAGFTWHKQSKHGNEHIATGNWTRTNVECCLFAIKGRPKRLSASVRAYLSTRVGEHSRKPQEVRERLVALVGDVPRIELFARERATGWDAWGLEAGCLRR